MSRICARPGCGSTASASLTYAYGDSIVWMTDLEPEAHPMIHDMCSMHAERVRVPRGWTMEDTREVTVLAESAQANAAQARSAQMRAEGGDLRLIGA